MEQEFYETGHDDKCGTVNVATLKVARSTRLPHREIHKHTFADGKRDWSHLSLFCVRAYMVAYAPHELPVNLILISIWM
jgi:hypothetical protein